MLYGLEQPFGDSDCQQGSQCSLQTATSITYTNQYGFSIGLKKRDGISLAGLLDAFNLGATFSYSESIQYTNTHEQNRPDDETSQCGYWTFVPELVE
jgi:hypothetical protein